LTQAEFLKLRTDFKALGARVRVVRVGIFEHAVRVAEVTKAEEALQSLNVNSKQVYKLTKRHGRERMGAGLRLTELLAGPVCAMTFEPAPASTDTQAGTDSVEPATLQKVLALIRSTNNKLMLLGGKMDDSVFAVDSLDRISKLPALPELQGQLLGLLSASAQRLVALLGSPAQRLAATVDGRRVQLEEEQGKSS
jgi:ribosomal protein L10